MKSITYIGAGFAPLHLDNPIKSMGYLGADTAPLKGGPMVCTSGPLWGDRRGRKRSASEVRKNKDPGQQLGEEFPDRPGPSELLSSAHTT